jgi:hypothetical protein
MQMISDQFFERLRAAYLEWARDFVGVGNSMWASLDQVRSSVHEALIRGGPELRETLLNPGSTRLYYGVEELYQREDRPNPDALASHLRSKLVELARALGLFRVHNPEGGMLYSSGGAFKLPDTNAILQALDRLLGVTLLFPNPFPEEAGLPTPKGIATERSINAIYQATLLKRLAKGSTLEIGAGMGKTAYYAWHLGIREYVIVDLPLSLVGQSIFLALTLGEDAVAFPQEPVSTGRIDLVSPSHFAADRRRFGLALNVDSMPEMDRSVATGYIERLRADGSYFVSINHEANEFTVNEIAPASAKVLRCPYWIRAGYVEEHYCF